MLDRAIVLDTETTGIDPVEHRLVELAAINLQNDTYFSKLCNPGRSIPPEAMAVHHITEDDCASADSPMTVTHHMLRALGEPPLVIAHNAKFDRGFMEPLLGAIRPTWLCTYKCSLLQWPDAPGHSNQVLRYWLGLRPDPSLLGNLAPHRALYDIIVTREIVRTLLQFQSLETLIKWSNNPVLLPKVTFGKHKGKLWSQVDRGYLLWCSRQDDMNEDVLFTANYWIRQK